MNKGINSEISTEKYKNIENKNIFSFLEDLENKSDDELAGWTTVYTKKTKPQNNILINMDSSKFIKINNLNIPNCSETVDFSEKIKMKPKKENHKKNICKNITNLEKCKYGDKCVFAHTLAEQNIDDIRKQAYKLIREYDDLSFVNIFEQKELYKTLLILNELCKSCEKGMCTGGYNCKFGACKKEYLVCSADLNNGSCNGNCGKNHLTKKGLIPYFQYIIKIQSQRKEHLKNDDNINNLNIFKNSFSDEYLSDITSESDDMEYNFDKSIFEIDMKM